MSDRTAFSGREHDLYRREQVLNQRISRTVLTDPDKAKRYHTDAATHHQSRGPFEIEKCETDLLDEEVARILALCNRAEDYVVLLSGRGSEFREHTERWLTANGVVYDELWMRAEGDRRPDDVVKSELFDAHVRDRFDVRFILDDRARVVALWRRLGLKCWQVDYGNF